MNVQIFASIPLMFKVHELISFSFSKTGHFSTHGVWVILSLRIVHIIFPEMVKMNLKLELSTNHKIQFQLHLSNFKLIPVKNKLQ